MLTVRLAATFALCLLPSAAAAQPWLEAFDARQYEKAAALLHEIVSDPQYALTERDPLPSRYLSRLYAEGLGVSRDSIVACALAQDAEIAAQMAHSATPLVTREGADHYQTGLQEARDFTAAQCGTLSAPDLTAASRVRGGCYAFGLDEQAWSIDGRTVRVGHDGIFVDDRPDQALDGFMCAAAVARVRAISIAPPANAAPGIGARHFIELIVWRNASDHLTGDRRYVASWHLLELDRRSLEFRAQETLQDSSEWPGPTMPADFDMRLSMEMVHSGHVRWRIDDAPPRRGWLMLPELRASR